jgi:hypothetical protein
MGDGMGKTERQFQRVESILGGSKNLSLDEMVDKFFVHMQRLLVLPCEVTGIEDFDWEEYYVLGPGSPKEYERLKKHQPSYRDRFELMAIKRDVVTEWMLFGGEDIGARVRRKSDGKEFCLGLSELKAIDRRSPNYQLLDDYAVFFTNYR